MAAIKKRLANGDIAVIQDDGAVTFIAPDGSMRKQTPTVPQEDGFFKSAAKSVVDSPTLPIAGGTIGAIAGGPPGAALGGAAGESFRQLGARALGMKAPETSLEAAKQIGMEGAVQGAGEAFFPPVLRVAGKGIAKGVSKIPYAKESGRFAKKTMGQLFQIVTKLKPENADTLFKNPKAILPGQMDKARADWRKAAEEAGIPIDDVSPEIIDVMKKDAKATVYETFRKISGGQDVSAAETQTAKMALRFLRPAAKTEKNGPLLAQYDKMNQIFIERLGKESPKLAAANKKYGIAKSGQRFHSVFPRNLDDSPAFFRSTVFPSLTLGAGAYRGEPGEGAMQAGLLAAASSPVVIGGGIALAGGGRRLLPYVRKAGTSAASKLAKDYLDR